jgi:hypothetical protein
MGKNAESQTSSDCRTVTAFQDYPTQADSRKELRNTIIPFDIQGSNQSGLKLTALPLYVDSGTPADHVTGGQGVEEYLWQIQTPSCDRLLRHCGGTSSAGRHAYRLFGVSGAAAGSAG